MGLESITSFSGLGLSGAQSGNYTLVGASGTVNITVSVVGLTVTNLVVMDKVYDGSTNAVLDATNAGLAGVINGDVVTLVSSNGVGNYGDKNVGTNKPVTVTGLTLGGAAAVDYTLLEPTNVTGNITPATLTISAVGNVKIYDGTVVALGSPVVGGLEGTDTVSGVVETYDTRNVGTGKTLSVSAYTVNDGNSGGNYTVNTVGSSAGVISPATLTISAAGNVKIYDGTVVALGSPVVGGLEGTDTVSGVVETYDTRNVGTGKTLSVSAYTVNDGNSGGNYTVNTVASNAGVINPATLTYTANPANMTYGSGVPALGGSVGGFVGTDNQGNATSGTLEFTTGATSESGVGSYAINGSGLSANNGNYVFVQAAGNGTALTIGALPVNLSGTRPYDGTTLALAGILSVGNKVGSDSVTVSGTGGTLGGKDVGLESITSFSGLGLSGAQSGNYTLVGASGTVNITVSVVGLTVTNLVVMDKVYDGSTNAVLDATNAGLAGVINGDVVTLVSSNGVGNYGDKNVGTNKPVTVTGLTLGGAAAVDYTLLEPTNVTGNITPATLTISAVGNVKIYDGTVVALGSPVVGGLEGTDTVSGVVETYDTRNVGTGKTLSVSAYTVNDGNSGGNYTVNTVGSSAGVISPATLTISAAGNVKIYDGTVVALGSPVVGGLEGTDTVSGVVETYDTRNVGTGKTLSVSAYTVNDGNSGGNYTVNTVASNAGVINPATLTYTANPANMTYGSGVPALGGSVGGFVGTDNQGNATSGTLEFTTGATSESGVGSYAINGSGLSANNGNYVFVQAAGNGTALTIGALPVNLSGTRPYDGTTLALAGILSVGNKVGSDSVTVSGTGGTLGGKDVGLESITSFSGLGLSGAQSGNYTLVGASGTVNITVSVVGLTVTNLVVMDKVYDGSTNAVLDATNAGLAGVINGDVVTLVSSNGVGNYGDKNVGTNKPVTVTGLTLGGAAAVDYTLLEPTNVTGNITPAGLSVSGVTAASKVYDGTSNASLSGAANLNGAVSGDDVSLVTGGVSATFFSPNVGTGIPVTVSGYAIIGTDAGNYVLSQPEGLSANITSKGVTVLSVPAPLITSIQLTNGIVTVTWNSVAGGMYRVQFINNLNGGTWTDLSPDVTATGSTATQTNAVGSATQQFYRIEVLNSGITANNKVYDGTTTATVNFNNLTLSGVMTGDSVGLATNSYTANFASAGVGTNIPVTVGGLSLNGAGAGNYTLTQPTGLTANITAAEVTILSGISANDKVYDGTTTATITSNNVVLSGVVNGDNIGLVTNGYVATFASPNAGTNIPVTVSGLTLVGANAGNYTLTQPTGLTANITPQIVVIVPAIPPPVITSIQVTSGIVNVTWNSVTGGVYRVQSINNLNGGAWTDLSPDVTATGSTAIQTNAIGSATQQFYRIEVLNSGVTANNKVYDGTTTATINFNNVLLGGVVTGDSVGLVTNGYTANFTRANVGTAILVMVSGLKLTGTKAANYTLKQPVGLTANITTAGVTIVSGISANNKVYDGTTTATIAVSNLTLSGVVNGDSVSLVASNEAAVFAGMNVGTNIPVTISGLTLSGSDASNYTLVQPAGLTANITPKVLTIASVVPPPVITSIQLTNGIVTVTWNSVTGGIYRVQFISDLNGDVWTDLSPDVTATGSTATQTNAVGGAPQQFYRVKLLNSGLNANDKVYDGTTAATISLNNAVLSGVVGSDAVTLTTNGYTANFASAGVGANIPVSVAGLTLSGASAGNYTLTQPTGLTANITGRIVTILPVPAPVITSIQLTNGIITITWNSVAGGMYRVQEISNLSGGAWTDLLPDVTATGSTATQTNAIGSATQQFYRIKVLNLGITANDKVYDGTTAATINSSNVVLAGVLGGDTVTLSSGGYTANFASSYVGTDIVVTVNGMSLSGANAADYTLAPLSGLTANITPATLTVTAVDYSRTYGLPNPQLTASYSGFVSGEGTNVLTGNPSLNAGATIDSVPGSYDISASVGTLSASNYNFAFVDGTLTVVALPQLSSVVLSNNQLSLAWPTIAGQSYQLEYSTNLSEPTWTPLPGPILGTGNPIIATNSLGVFPQQFFRLSISP